MVFGGSTVGSGGSLDLTSLNGSNGFRAFDVENDARVGKALSAGGDINGDGIDDFLVSAFLADTNPTNAGQTFLTFGATNVGNNPVRLLGDVNGDGFGDALIGAPSYGAGDAGAGFLVLGSASGFANGTLSGLTRFDGESAGDNVGDRGIDFSIPNLRIASVDNKLS